MIAETRDGQLDNINIKVMKCTDEEHLPEQTKRLVLLHPPVGGDDARVYSSSTSVFISEYQRLMFKRANFNQGKRTSNVVFYMFIRVKK